MKKFSFFTATATIAMVVVLFISCQKEQSAVVEETNVNRTTEGAISGVSGSGPYAGSIPSSYAAALAANYGKKYGDDDKQAQSVAFSAKDLIAFINSLQTKYKSDVIYVNFGVYGKGAAPVNSKDYGKLTVFFTGNKIPGASSTRRNNSTQDDFTNNDQFLNHGQIYP